MTFEFRYEDKILDRNLVKKHAQQFNLPIKLVEFLHYKDINNSELISTFLEPSLDNLNDPFLFDNMAQVVDKINKAVASKSKILIVGDYDTDGICATTILYDYLKSKKANITYYIPNRFSDGYGLTLSVVEKIKKDINPDLLITVDCGISCHEEIALAQSKGIDVIVTDHHEMPDTLPNCLIINPKQACYPFKGLCGAGVAFKLVEALAGREKAKKYLFICAIATVADIVPLTDENRAIVKLGLDSDYVYVPLGIKTFIKQLQIKKLTAQDISFKLAPRINTAGRMGDASVALRLLLEDNELKIKEIIEELTHKNDVRLIACEQILNDCQEMLKNINVSQLNAIVLYKENWQNGVLGIVCSKLVEMYNKPVCLLSLVDDNYKGSARSIPNIDFYDALSNISDILIQFGGHNQAGGLTITKDKIAQLSPRLNAYLEKYNKDVFKPVKYYDIDYNDTIIDLNFIKALDRFRPFGLNNEKPIFKINLNQQKATTLPNYKQHIKIIYNKLNIVGYNYGNIIDNFNLASTKDVLADIDIDTYFAKPKLKAVIKAVTYGKIDSSVKEDTILSYYLAQLKYIKYDTEPNYTSIKKQEFKTYMDGISGSLYGTLFVASTYDSYNNFAKNFPQINTYEVFRLNNITGVNALLFAPTSIPNLTSYNRVVFLDRPLCNGYICEINKRYPNTTVCVVNNFNNIFVKLNVDRGVFGTYHNAISYTIEQKITADNRHDYYTILKKLTPQFKNLTELQFTFVCLVLEELKILKFDKEFILNKGVKNPLKNSQIYAYVSKELNKQSE